MSKRPLFYSPPVVFLLTNGVQQKHPVVGQLQDLLIGLVSHRFQNQADAGFRFASDGFLPESASFDTPLFLKRQSRSEKRVQAIGLNDHRRGSVGSNSQRPAPFEIVLPSAYDQFPVLRVHRWFGGSNVLSLDRRFGPARDGDYRRADGDEQNSENAFLGGDFHDSYTNTSAIKTQHLFPLENIAIAQNSRRALFQGFLNHALEGEIVIILKKQIVLAHATIDDISL